MWNKRQATAEEHEEEMRKENASPAAAKKISMDAAVVAVLSKLNHISALKGEQRMVLEALKGLHNNNNDKKHVIRMQVLLF